MSLPILRILSVSAVAVGLRHTVMDFQRDTGIKCSVNYQTSTQMRDLDWKQPHWDVVITSKSLALELSTLGAVDLNSALDLGRVGVGLAVHDSCTLIAPQSTPQLIQALERATTVVYNRASSGHYVESLFDRLGLMPMMAPKTQRVLDGQALLKCIAQEPEHGQWVIGLGAVTEILEVKGWGVKLAGMLPAENQHLTSYQAMATPLSTPLPYVQAFITALASAKAKALFASSGVLA